MSEWLEILIAVPFLYLGLKLMDRLFPCAAGHVWRTTEADHAVYEQTCQRCGKVNRFDYSVEPPIEEER